MGIQEKLPIAFGTVLRRLRLEAGLSQEALGFEADLQRTYISILELGQQVPSLATVMKLSAALELEGSTLVAQVEKELRKSKK